MLPICRSRITRSGAASATTAPDGAPGADPHHRGGLVGQRGLDLVEDGIGIGGDQDLRHGGRR